MMACFVLEPVLEMILPFIRTKDDSSFLKIVVDATAGDKLFLRVPMHQRRRRSVEASFADARESVCEDGPCLLLIRVDHRSNSSKWAMITWIPPSTGQEMAFIYVAARKRIEEELGSLYSYIDYDVHSKAQLYPGEFYAYLHFSPQALDDCTLLEKRLLQMQTVGDNQKILEYPIPMRLTLSKELEEALGRLIEKKENFLAVKISDNAFATLEFSYQIRISSVASMLVADSPRYYILVHEDKKVLFLFVPESSKKHELFLYSAMKCSLIFELRRNGFNIWRTLETRNAEELNELLSQQEFDTKGDLLTKVHPKPLPPGNRYSDAILNLFNANSKAG